MDINKLTIGLKEAYNMILTRHKKALEFIEKGNSKQIYIDELDNIMHSLNSILAVLKEKGIEYTQSEILNGFKFEKTVKEAS